jgi:hypothetical protein
VQRAVHLIEVLTAAGDSWAPKLKPIKSLRLAVQTACLLRDYLRGVGYAQADAPEWAAELRKCIEEDGAAIRGCVVRVVRRTGSTDKHLIGFEVGRSVTLLGGLRRTG